MLRLPDLFLSGKDNYRQGVSSIGRVAVSKTVGWGFKSLTPCQPGGVAEWSIAAVLKTAVGNTHRGFESLPLRHYIL